MDFEILYSLIFNQKNKQAEVFTEQTLVVILPQFTEINFRTKFEIKITQ
jgi:hypothetical protein